MPSSVSYPVTPASASYHLTAHAWYSLEISRNDYLAVLDGICHYLADHQDQRGAIIDPYLEREHQFATPYFAFSVGTLLHFGWAQDLVERGVRAMDHATRLISSRDGRIPDNHGEYFLAALPRAYELLKQYVPANREAQWRKALSAGHERLLLGPDNHSRTFAMKGQWELAQRDLLNRENAARFIEECWAQGQGARVSDDGLGLYRDNDSTPDSFACEAMARSNFLGLLEGGYDGPCRIELEEVTQRGTESSLLLQDPTGQCPPNGPADNHVFNDAVYLLNYEHLARRAYLVGEIGEAGQYRRAALLAFSSLLRWWRQAPGFSGSFFVTKNRFAPELRVGYQAAGNYASSNSALAYNLAQACLVRQSSIEERPAPSEIGGYAFTTGEDFSAAVANAGGLQILAALRGDQRQVQGRYWSALGVERIARTGWDSRLGPSDGVRDAVSGRGVSLAPTWSEGASWLRMADCPDRYSASFQVELCHPALVICALRYFPVAGEGPEFLQRMTITPNGILTTLTCSQDIPYGLTCPLLENDGRPLKVDITGSIASTALADDGDQQNFISLHEAQIVSSDSRSLLSSYGWLKPVRVSAAEGKVQVFIYPRKTREPQAEEVLDSFTWLENGFRSVLGTVEGHTYVGPTCAGGVGSSAQLGQYEANTPEGENSSSSLVFSEPCGFLAQLRNGKIKALEADRAVQAQWDGISVSLQAHQPVHANRLTQA